MTAPAAALEAPGLVLDTNVVLEWLVFRDPGRAELVAAIESGAVRWLVASAFRDEMAAVLARGVGADRRPDLSLLWAQWDRHAHLLPAAPLQTERSACRCTDPDDQKFVDFALHSGARWLLSHDKAVLKLAAPAHRFGLSILTPGRWRSNC